MKRYFHSELEEIRSKLVLICEKASKAGSTAVDSFLNSNIDLAQEAFDMDDEIDALEGQIDRESVRYITLRSPVSTDVRLTLVAIKASRNLERAGDEAHSIAKNTRNILKRDGTIKETAEIGAMSVIAFEMMNDAIASLIEEDAEKAYTVIKRDKSVDRIHKSNFKTLVSSANGDTASNTTCVETILISKSIERIGDHAKNLAEDVIYLLTGEEV